MTADSDITHNLNALKIIETAIGYRPDSDRLCASISDQTVAKIYFDFLTICPEFYFTENDKINKLLKVLPKLSDSHLIEVLRTVTSWQIENLFVETVVRKLVSNIDNELSFRFNMRTDADIDNEDLIENLLFVANLFFRLNSAKVCRFNRLLIRWISVRQLSLTKEQLLQFLFYVNIVLKVDLNTKNYIRCHTEQHINDMTLDEMSVACMTFYKVGIRLSDNLVRKVIQKSLTSITDETDSFIKTDILKVIRFSYNYTYKREVQSLIQRYKQLDNNIVSLIQMISLLTKAKLYDKSIFDQTFEILLSNANLIRAKYVERLLLNASEVNHRIDSHLISTLSQYISDNRPKFEQYLCQIVCHLCSYKHFPEELIELCFDRRFLNRIESMQPLIRLILFD